MFAVKAKIYGVLYKLPSSIAFDETSSYWSAPKKAPNFSAFHWSPHGSLVSIGQYFVTTRVVHLPKRTETSLITKSEKTDLINSYCSYVRPAQPRPIPAALAGINTIKWLWSTALFFAFCTNSKYKLITVQETLSFSLSLC